MDQELIAYLDGRFREMSEQIQGLRQETSQQIQGLRQETAEQIQGSRQEVQGSRQEVQGLRQEVQGLRQEMMQEIGELRQETSQQIQGLRQETSQQISSLREELGGELRQTRILVEAMRSEIQLLAEGYMGLGERLEVHQSETLLKFDEIKASIAPYYQDLNRRVTVLEAKESRRDRDILEVFREKYGQESAALPSRSDEGSQAAPTTR